MAGFGTATRTGALRFVHAVSVFLSARALQKQGAGEVERSPATNGRISKAKGQIAVMEVVRKPLFAGARATFTSQKEAGQLLSHSGVIVYMEGNHPVMIAPRLVMIWRRQPWIQKSLFFQPSTDSVATMDRFVKQIIPGKLFLKTASQSQPLLRTTHLQRVY